MQVHGCSRLQTRVAKQYSTALASTSGCTVVLAGLKLLCSCLADVFVAICRILATCSPHCEEQLSGMFEFVHDTDRNRRRAFLESRTTKQSAAKGPIDVGYVADCRPSW